MTLSDINEVTYVRLTENGEQGWVIGEGLGHSRVFYGDRVSRNLMSRAHFAPFGSGTFIDVPDYEGRTWRSHITTIDVLPKPSLEDIAPFIANLLGAYTETGDFIIPDSPYRLTVINGVPHYAVGRKKWRRAKWIMN